MPIVVDTSGLEKVTQFLASFPQVASRALSLAINDTLRDTIVPLAKKEMLAEVNFAPGTLDDPSRFGVSQFSTASMLTGIVTGRSRPTSLFQFAQLGPADLGQRFPSVASIQVKPGRQISTKRLFIVGLRAGTATAGNEGIAIRLRPGEKLSAVDRFNPIELYPNVYLLYAPSIDQVFKGVAADIAPAVLDAMDAEFTRQFNRLIQ